MGVRGAVYRFGSEERIRAGLGNDPGGYRQEFLGLVQQAEGLVQ